MDEPTSNYLRVNGASFVDLAIGGTTQVRLQDGILFAIVNNDVALGTTSYRFSSINGVLANFSGLATLGGNFAMAANTSGYVPIADGTNFCRGRDH